MSVQSSPIPTVTIPSIALRELLDSNCELRKQRKELETELKVMQQKYKILEDKERVLENKSAKLENEKTKEETSIQLMEEDLQSDKRCPCWCNIRWWISISILMMHL